MEQLLNIHFWLAVVASITVAIGAVIWLFLLNGHDGSASRRVSNRIFSGPCRAMAARKIVVALLMLMSGALVLLGASIAYTDKGILSFVGGALLVFGFQLFGASGDLLTPTPED